MEATSASIGIFGGMGIVVLVLSLWKVIKYRFRKSKDHTKPNFWFWLANNWMDYFIHMGITAIFFYFEHDVLNLINPLLEKWGIAWQIPHPENKGFLFVMVPLFVSLILYKVLRKYLSEPTQASIAPHIHDKFYGHNQQSGTVNPDPTKPPPPPK